jgi:hypothetical protein
MPNPTCRLLSNGYRFENYQGELVYKPCCHFNESQKLDAPAVEHRAFRDRLNVINSYESDSCNICNFQNNKKIRTTWRDRSFQIVPVYAKLGDASHLEIQTDKTCNGGCIICGPWHSSYWQNELKQFTKKPKEDPIDKILSQIDIQKTKRISFLGGEPFLTNTDTKVLSMIDHPKRVNLVYVTNGSIYPTDQRIKLWSQFEYVSICFSIDAIGDRFDYIRYPLKWAQVEKNINRIINECPKNMFFKANYTVNPLNIYYHDEFTDWYDRTMGLGGARKFDFTPCDGILSPQKLPKKLVDMLVNKYGHDSKVMSPVVEKDCDDHSKLLLYLSELDSRRGLDWRQVFPEISDCFPKV